MARRIAVLAIALALGWPVLASAQEAGAGAGRVEINFVPAGGTFFIEGKDASETEFGNYNMGVAGTYNINRLVGIEGELDFGIGVKQRLNVGGLEFEDTPSPNTLGYNANLVVSPWGSDRSVIPYFAGGGGGLTMYEKDELWALGLAENETFFTMNVGAGTKWYANQHWGIRGDYRLFWVNGKENAPSFFGVAENRYGHRIVGSLLFTFGE
jgi:hypothetical protein